MVPDVQRYNSAATEVISKLYMETGNIKSKDPQIMSFICNLVIRNWKTTGHKTLIFAHHELVRSRMSIELSRYNIKHVNISGSSLPVERIKLVSEVSDPNSNTIAAVCSITASSVGYNFVPGPTIIIFLEYIWNISDTLQAEARIARFGATVPTVYSYYIHCGSLYDRRLLMNLKEKFIVNSKTIDGIKDIDVFDKNREDFTLGQFSFDKEIEYKDQVYDINNYNIDNGVTEVAELKDLQKELNILADYNKEPIDKNELIKDMNTVKLDLDKIVDEEEL